MEKLNVKTKDGLSVYQNYGNIYFENNKEEGVFEPMPISDMIKLLSHNKIYPKIKFDNHFELICENLNKPVIGNTLNKAFVNLIIMLFG